MAGTGFIINVPRQYDGKASLVPRVNSTEGKLNISPVGIGKVIVLTDAAPVVTNAGLGDEFTLTMTASRTFSNPTNGVAGQKIIYSIKQGGTGSYTITWDSKFRFSTDIPQPTLTTTVGKKDRIGFLYDGVDDKWDCIAVSRGY